MAAMEGCQHHFSRLLPGAMYDRKGREEKGKKILAVLSDFLKIWLPWMLGVQRAS
jgi:hypothetical protein